MQLTLKVQPLEGDAYTVDTSLYTIVALERRFKIRASDLATGIAMEHLAFLAYEAAKQVNIPVPPVFDEFVKRLQGVEVVTTEPINPPEAEPLPEP